MKKLTVNTRIKLFSAAYLLLMVAALVFEAYFLLAVPAALLVVYFTLYRYDVVLKLIVLATPLSFNFEDLGLLGGVGFYFPTEPLLFGMLLLFLIESFRRVPVDKEILRHPLTVVIFAQLGWILVSAYTSSMPFVSYKFLIARLWFVVVMYLMAANIFKRIKNIKQFIWLYVISLCGVVIYTVIHHSQYAFSSESAHWVMSPFYKDHTSYGAILALYLPIVIGLLFLAKNEINKRFWLILFLAILVLGTVLSYTRAAWVSLAVAAGVFIIIKFRIKFWIVATAGVVLIGSFFLYQDQILYQLEKNKQDSSQDFAEHVESISNISSDASNLERLNRWNCAIRMWMDRPLFGFGPGTYQFQYAPYQSFADRTIISTNSGDGGNAHSEYLGPLSEQGIVGALLVLVFVSMVIYYGIRTYKNAPDMETKVIALCLTLGLITYFTHGVLNNYLDTDKASIPVWSFIASIIAIEVYHTKKKSGEIESRPISEA